MKAFQSSKIVLEIGLRSLDRHYMANFKSTHTAFISGFAETKRMLADITKQSAVPKNNKYTG